MSSAPPWAPLFFAISASSWVPHWSCHYYRLETGSGFAVGSWSYTTADSVVALAFYSALIIANLSATITTRVRMPVALLSGALHLGFAALHFYRLYRPFRFEVFGYPWSLSASLREAVILFVFGTLSIFLAMKMRQQKRPSN